MCQILSNACLNCLQTSAAQADFLACTADPTCSVALATFTSCMCNAQNNGDNIGAKQTCEQTFANPTDPKASMLAMSASGPCGGQSTCDF
jgi:hypothetical protein